MDTARLRSSWHTVAGFGGGVPLFFYSILFPTHPNLREMFPAGMPAQRDKLVRALGKVVTSVDELDAAVPFLGFFAGADMNRLKGKQIEFFAGALGGPDHYRGQTMKEAHRGRGIGQAEFDRVAQLLADSLRDPGVPDLVGQILTAIGPLAEGIVSPTAAPAAQA